MCATAVRATIKTVGFSTSSDSTSSKKPDGNTRDHYFDSLTVTSVVDKEYRDPEAYPVLGVKESGLRLGEIQPIWGLVSPAYEGFPNLSMFKQPSLYLVGHSGSYGDAPRLRSGMTPGTMNLPGATFAVAVANTVLDRSFGVSAAGWPLDLLSRANMAVLTRWQDLSRTAAGAGRIVDLLWTDLAASAVVGTRGVLGPGNVGGEPAPVRVRPLVRRTRFNHLFGILAYALLLVIVVVSGLVSVAWISRRRASAR